ncbi:Smr domain-containing protein [Cnuella takakiae]|uniref:Smr domain-containing protein n=1 Tax=Cnuella takakiae TaxID=1302690 RepID=A0A1M4XQW0_9BACT|nr:Smr/MutS family protein [Cnuella takakiae]OLY94854.1 hypothetical protein BUE76_14205 [Cnuella takakiae]SHE95879.1 Smr domain-containing protein [Cnuella takakiae]
MKFQVGDKVLVKHSNEEGEVIEIINKEMVMVEVRGVRFPAYIDQLDFPYFKRFSEKKMFGAKKEKRYVEDLPKDKVKGPRIIDGVWLSFLPVFDTDEFGDDVVELLKVHLINRTERTFKFKYKLQFFGDNEFELKGEINPQQDFYLHDIPFGDMSDNPQFQFEFSLPEPEKGKAPFFETNTKLKGKQIFQQIQQIQEKGEPTFKYRLFEHYPEAVKEEPVGLDLSSLVAKGVKVYNAKEARRHLPPARSVVDLHIEKLEDSWEYLTNAEILDIQLREFEKWYELAVAHHLPHLIMIHGVGTGKLRDEIHDALRLKREVKSFVNRYHPAYGYGATEIYF